MTPFTRCGETEQVDKLSEGVCRSGSGTAEIEEEAVEEGRREMGTG